MAKQTWHQFSEANFIHRVKKTSSNLLFEFISLRVIHTLYPSPAPTTNGRHGNFRRV